MRIDRTRLYDKRVVQRNIRAERVTKDEYAAWLGELPDVSDKIKPRDEGGDDDGYEQSAQKTVEPATDATAAPAPAPAPDGSEPVAASPAQMPPSDPAG